MFCLKCGTELTDETRFCPTCGQAVESDDTPKSDTAAQVPGYEKQAEAPVKEDISASKEMPVASSPFSDPDVSEKKKKKPGKKKILGIVAAVVAVALVVSAVAVALNFNTMRGSMIKLFGSDMDYFQFVESRALKRYAESTSDLYDALLFSGNSQQNQGVTTTLGWNISDDAIEMMEYLTGSGVDLTWLNKVELKIDANKKKDLASVAFGVNVSDQDILTLSEIIDYASGNMYLSVPALTDRTVMMHLADMTDSSVSDELPESFELISKVGESLPSKEIYNKILARYIDVALENIDDITLGEETLEIEGVSQKCTVLEARISEKTFCDMMNAVLKEMKKDEDLKSILKSMQDSLSGSELPGGDFDVYEVFIDAVDNTIEALDDVREYASDKKVLVITSYVNSKHEVIGRKVAVNGNTVLDYAIVEKGGDFASELRIGKGDESLVLKGSGTQKGNKKNGSYTLRINGIHCFDIEIADFDTKAFEKGYVNGTFRLTPQKQLLSQSGIGSIFRILVSGMNPTLELKCRMSEKDASLEINLLSKNDVFVGVTVKSSVSAGKDIEIPAKNLISLKDGEDVVEFIESIDLGNLIENLRKTEIPADIIDFIEEAAGSIEDLLFGYDDDYRYGDGCWDGDDDFPGR